MCKRYAEEFERSLRDKLIPEGLLEQGPADRFRQSFEIMLGQDEASISSSPGSITSRSCRKSSSTTGMIFRASTRSKRRPPTSAPKCCRSCRTRRRSGPTSRTTRRARREIRAGMKENPDWSAFYLWRDGEIVPENAARCPKTMAALADFPLVHIQNRSPSVLFSLLRPRSRIPPHTGIVNTRLICHLPLLVPPDCGLRVGNDARRPVEGKAWLFDDTIEHEAWNDSDHPRVILLFETWRPELTAKERRLVTAMFERDRRLQRHEARLGNLTQPWICDVIGLIRQERASRASPISRQSPASSLDAILPAILRVAVHGNPGARGSRARCPGRSGQVRGHRRLDRPPEVLRPGGRSGQDRARPAAQAGRREAQFPGLVWILEAADAPQDRRGVRETRAATDAEGITSITSNVLEFARTPRGLSVFILENGQIWRQVGGRHVGRSRSADRARR